MLRNPTPEACRLKDALEKYGITVHAEFDDGHKSVDLAIPEAKLHIEVDGIHHLIDPNQINADLNRDYYSSENGIGTIHVHNWEIHEDVERIAYAIADTATRREESINRKRERKEF